MIPIFPLDIPRKGSHCCEKGEPFLPGMEMYSVLFGSEPEKIVRHDYCSRCWNEGEKPNASLTYWKSTIQQKKENKKTSRVEKAISMLRDLLQQTETDEGELYILCLFLSRARQLALRQEYIREGISYQTYEILSSEEFCTIKAIDMSEKQIKMIQESFSKRVFCNSNKP